jgi:serine/threonine protein kinase
MVNMNVVAKQFPQQYDTALRMRDPIIAHRTYEDGLALPTTATEQELDNVGYTLNGNLITNNNNLIICFKETTPYIIKILTQKEYDNMTTLFKILKEPNAHIVTITELIKTKHNKLFAIMPILPATLKCLPSLSTPAALRFWEHMKSALQHLHTIHFSHNDIKPSNICLNNNGEFVIIDLGSARHFGSPIGSTRAYHPKGVDFSLASRHIDWWMLAATFTEKACGWSTQWRGGPSNPTTEQVLNIIQQQFASVWAELKELLL